MQASLQRCAPRGVEIYAAYPLGRESVRQAHTLLFCDGTRIALLWAKVNTLSDISKKCLIMENGT